MKTSRTGILIIIILVIVTFGLAVFGPMFFKKEAGNVQMPPQGSRAAITAKGVVESEEKVEISSQVKGSILKITADEGDMVQKGAPLVMLDSSKINAQEKVAEATLDEAKTRLRELRSGYRIEDIDMAKSRAERAGTIYSEATDEYERQKRLYSKNATTLNELQKAEERMNVASAELSEAKANWQKFQKGARAEEKEEAAAMVEKASSELTYQKALLKEYTILSPINGLVVERFRDAGETMDVGTPILKLINTERLRINAELEETDVGRVTEGQPVEVYTDAYGNKVYHGKVYMVLPAVKRKSQKTFDPMASFDVNTQTLYIRLDNFSGLKNGMTVTVRFLK